MASRSSDLVFLLRLSQFLHLPSFLSSSKCRCTSLTGSPRLPLACPSQVVRLPPDDTRQHCVRKGGRTFSVVSPRPEGDRRNTQFGCGSFGVVLREYENSSIVTQVRSCRSRQNYEVIEHGRSKTTSDAFAANKEHYIRAANQTGINKPDRHQQSG